MSSITTRIVTFTFCAVTICEDLSMNVLESWPQTRFISIISISKFAPHLGWFLGLGILGPGMVAMSSITTRIVTFTFCAVTICEDLSMNVLESWPQTRFISIISINKFAPAPRMVS